MNNTNKLLPALMLIMAFLFVIAIMFDVRRKKDDYRKEYKELEMRYDSLNKVNQDLMVTIDSVKTIIDSSKTKIEYITKTKYEKINNIDVLTADSVLSILTIYLSEKSKD